MRTSGVVVLPPHLDDHAYFFERVENLAVQTFIAQLAVERFAVTVLPGAARLDEQRARADRLQSRAPAPRPHLRAVVAPHVLGSAVLKHRLAQRFDDVKTIQPPCHANRQAFARVFIDQPSAGAGYARRACAPRRNRNSTHDWDVPAAVRRSHR